MFERLEFFPEQASTVAGRTDAVFLFLVGISVFFSVGICTALVVMAVRYRRRADRRARPTRSFVLLEVAWIVVPLLVALTSFAWGAAIYYDARTPPRDRGMELFVTAKQWMWKIQHPTGQREINTLHVPAGRPVILTMTSEDVIHSFFIPAFRVKQDVLPGRYTRLWFEATRPGRYHLFCAEYCGTKHSEMVGDVVVLEPDRYQRWLLGQTADLPPAEAGAVLFKTLRCDTCHSAESGARGPDLAGLFGTQRELADGRTVAFDADHVRESMLEPRARITKGFEPLMPTYRGQVTEGQVLQIVAYLKTLGKEEAR